MEAVGDSTRRSSIRCWARAWGGLGFRALGFWVLGLGSRVRAQGLGWLGGLGGPVRNGKEKVTYTFC